MNEHVSQHYDASDIQVLEGLEAVRKRPGMYIGTTSSRGLHHLVWEIVDNAIDEALAGYCDDIEIIINKDNSVTVKDDGRGIPTGIHPKTGISTVETVYTVLHAGGKFGGGGYKVSGGLHGVGASVVNALSSWVEVTVYQNGKVNYIKFENGGHTVAPMKVISDCSIDRTGTTVTFKPDPEIFKETTVFDYDILRQRVRELAFLNKGLRIILCDDRYDKKQVVSHSNQRVDSIPVKDSTEVLQHIKKLPYAVAFDEAQFFDAGLIEIIERLANSGVRVIVAGLDQDFRGNPFGIMPELMARAEYVTKLQGICMVCGDPATRTQRLINGHPADYDDPTILVSASEKYESRCRHCHQVPHRAYEK